MSIKILVTGANGQLGNEIRTAANRYSGLEFIFLGRKELAIEQQDAVNAVFEKYAPLFCINCAAYTAVDKAETDVETAFMINGRAVGFLAEACHRFNARLVHISTDYVFNGRSTIPYRENDPVDPVNLYGASKLKGEELIAPYAADAIIIRTSWVYSFFGNNFVKTMMRLMKERESLSVVNDQIGSPTYAADLAVAILDIISAGTWKAGTYHYSNDGVISWYDFAVAIQKLTNSTCNVTPINSAQYPTPAGRPGYSVLNKEKIISSFPLIELKDWKVSLTVCINLLQ